MRTGRAGAPLAAFVAAAALGAWASCATAPVRSGPDGACRDGKDCSYGLHCDRAKCIYDQYGECAEDKDCLSGQKCRSGQCTVQCATSFECGKGRRCLVGTCAAESGGAPECLDNRDCVPPESCVGGHCVAGLPSGQCQADLDCGVGMRCVFGQCRY